MSAPSRFPLAWPIGKPRTAPHLQKSGQFRVGDSYITNDQAMSRVEKELDRLDGKYPLLSTNVELRVDGRPRADRKPPADQGVCLYFEIEGKPFAMACDTYTTVAMNIAAIAAHLEATRAIARYGVATAAESLQAFSALPPPPPGGSIIIGQLVKPWHEVLGVSFSAPAEVIEAAYRALARRAHPDAPGGSTAIMQALNQARDAGLKAAKL